jgi:hypothetical protein
VSPTSSRYEVPRTTTFAAATIFPMLRRASRTSSAAWRERVSLMSMARGVILKMSSSKPMSFW